MRPQIHNTFCICICIYVYICICICICISLRPGCLFDLNCGNCCGREHPPLLRPTVTANLRSAAQASWQIYLKTGQEYIAHFGRNTFVWNESVSIFPLLLRPTVTANLRSAAQASWKIYLKTGQEYVAHFGRNAFRLKRICFNISPLTEGVRDSKSLVSCVSVMTNIF